jgi:hypothetical protein
MPDFQSNIATTEVPARIHASLMLYITHTLHHLDALHHPRQLDAFHHPHFFVCSSEPF